MKQPYSDSIDDILPRYCEGDVSPEERMLVEEWMSQSDDNYRIAKQIHAIYLAADTLHVIEKVDTEKALTNVTARMTPSRKVNWLLWMQRIAAVLFIPVLIALLVQDYTDQPQLAQLIEVRTNPGITTTVHLPDGSVVHLNSESYLSYPSFFDKKVRSVTLKGEAFFSVSKDEKKRFVVSTPHQTRVEVLGTTFNVEAFEKDTIVSTTLIEGKVNFLYTRGNQSETVVLKPGQKLVYNSNALRTELLHTSGESETAWKDGKIIFAGTPLPKALQMLEKRYNVEFVIHTRQYEEDSFTGSFKHQRLDRILEVFKRSSNIKWRYMDTEKVDGEKTRIEIY